jgi:hypothetical protein
VYLLWGLMPGRDHDRQVTAILLAPVVIAAIGLLA